MSIIKNKISLIGLGKCGGKAVEKFAAVHMSPMIQAAVIDSDSVFLSTLEGIKKINAGAQRTENLGCGGNPETGKKAIRDDINAVKAFIQDSHFVIIVAGLGGGFSSGASVEMAQMLRELPVTPIFVVTTPFNIEGALTENRAKEAMDLLHTKCKNIINLSSNLIYSQSAADEELPVLFKIVDDALIEGIYALIDIIKYEPNDTLTVDFSAVVGGLGKRQRACALSYGLCEGKAFDQLVKNFAACPLSGGKDYITASSLVILKLTAPILTTSETKEFLAEIDKQLNCGEKINIGFHFEKTAVKCGLSGLIIKDSEQHSKKRTASSSNQLELNLIERSRGIFTGLPPRIHDSEGYDINIPTFQRLEIDLNEN